MTEERRIDLSKIVADRAVSQRARVDAGAVADFAADMESGSRFPPLVVFRDGEGLYHLADGFHRLEAARRAGLKTFPCLVRAGTKRDATLYACGANAGTQVRRTAEDKRRAVNTLLDDPEWAKWSNRAIAKACNLNSDHLPRTMKAERSIPAEEVVYEREGEVRLMKVGDIAARPAAPVSHLAGKIDRAMKRSKINAGELADRAGLVRTHLYAILRGDRAGVNLDTATRLAAALGCRLDSFADPEVVAEVRSRMPAEAA